MSQIVLISYSFHVLLMYYVIFLSGSHYRHRIVRIHVVGFSTTCAISAYHH